LIKTVTDASAGLLAAYRQKMTRGFFTYEESTYLVRNELGNFFQGEDAARAVAQYKKVLAIDPWDITALYRIGRAYDGNGQWQKAAEYYKRVFWADPSYENASGLYNQIAREHADTIDVSASYLADTASVEWGVDAKYSIELNEVLGLDLSYAGINKRIYRWEKYQVTSNGVIDYSYMVQSFSLGFPLAFGASGLLLTPTLGFDVTSNDRLYNEETNPIPFDSYGTKNITPFDFISFNNLYPEARLDFSLSAGSPVSVTGSAFFGLQPETLGYLKRDVYEIGGTLNVGTSFSGFSVPILRNTSLRVYGEGHYLFDTNTPAGFNFIWAGLGELSYVIVHTDEPAFTLSIFGNAYYQDSTIAKSIAEYDSIDYYSPQEVLLAGGGFNMTSYTGIGDGNVLGVGFSGGAFYATQYELYPVPGGFQQRLKIQADASLEYTRGNSTLYVKPEFVMTPNLVMPDSLWDYWDFYIVVGYTAKLPALLTQ
jgi:hypothetical protein